MFGLDLHAQEVRSAAQVTRSRLVSTGLRLYTPPGRCVQPPRFEHCEFGIAAAGGLVPRGMDRLFWRDH